jgi:uncharacterized damage-inducible protein DinB
MHSLNLHLWNSSYATTGRINLSEDQLAAMIPGAYGTIRDTLGHIIRAEAHYLRLLTGSCPQPLFKWEDRPSLAEMTAYAAQVGEALVDMAQRTLPTYQVVEEEATSFGIKRWLCSSRLSITASSIAQTSRQSSIKVC